MEIKKSKKADLEGTRGTGLLIGYIVGLSAIFACFEWTTRTYEDKAPVLVAAPPTEMAEEIPPMTQPVFPVNLPPAPAVPDVPEVLDIVKDDTQIEEKEMVSSESTTEATTVSSAVATGPVVAAPAGPTVEASDEEEIFEVVEQQPEFPGGMEKLMQYLSKSLKYPASAAENNIQGRVICSFVVNRDGSIVEPKVIKSIDPALDKEAIRVIKAMPKWTPGRQRGKAVRVRYTLPVMFRLQ